jgi:hypothetical protein
LVEPRQPLQNVAAAAGWIGPNPREKLPAEALRTAGRKLRAGPTEVSHLAPEDTPKTDDAREIQEDDGVTGSETQIERTAIVPVDDPRLAPEDLLHLRLPLIWRRRLPTRAPIVRIEVDEGQRGALRQASGDRGLPGSARADYEDALHLMVVTQPPNGSRLSCGALKKDSFPNLRAPPTSSAC